eukprot:jgi/Galph1/5756/GphlegSOOS_G4373.1
MPLKICYDKRSLIINNERIFLLCGAIHYPRIHVSQWEHTLNLAKDFGLNSIETYIFWSRHEKERGVFDFTENNDLCKFLKLAWERGLYVVLRIGPYICAETNYGGFPLWLQDIENIEFRTYNSSFLQETERWISYVVQLLRDNALFYPQGGPIILVQLENEYDIVSCNYGSKGIQYLQWYQTLYNKLEIDVPLIMCQNLPTKEENSVAPMNEVQEEQTSIALYLETMNGFYAHQHLKDHFQFRQDQPAIWTEFWIGWYDLWGTRHRVRSVEDILYAAVCFIAAGGSGINYYMFRGGTNFGNLSMLLQTTSYDYDAPVDEYGRKTIKYHLLKRFNMFIQNMAPILLKCNAPKVVEKNTDVTEYIWNEPQEVKCSFLCNQSQKQIYFFTYENKLLRLNPNSVKIFLYGTEVMDTSLMSDSDTNLRLWVLLPSIESGWKEEMFPIVTENMSSNGFCFQSPVSESLKLVSSWMYETDYCWFTCEASLPIKKSCWVKRGLLKIEAADIVHVFLNSQYMGSTLTFSDERFAKDKNGFLQMIPLYAAQDLFIEDSSVSDCLTFHLSLLVCSLGMIKGEFQLWSNANMRDEKKGIFCQPTIELELSTGEERLVVQAVCNKEWHCHPLLFEKNPTRYKPMVPPLSIGPRIYETNLIIENLSELTYGLVLDVRCMTKGLLYWNDFCLGRYWITPTDITEDRSIRNSPIEEQKNSLFTQQYYFVPKGIIQEQNSLKIFEELYGQPESIRVLLPQD